jgi:hypothetical protein
MSVEVPYPVFTDRNGDPLEDGYVWIGQANQSPQTNPAQVYFDRDLTQPAAQPLRTINGYISNAGTPSQIYIDGNNYSILVHDKKGTMVYNFADGTGIAPLPNDSCGLGYTAPFPNSVPRFVCEKLAESVSVKDFGAVGDGVTDDSAAIQSALDAASAIYFPEGDYYIASTLNLPDKNMSLFGDGRVSKIIGSVSPLVKYDPNFTSNTANIYDLSFEATADNTSIQMHGTWTASGKVGPTIRGCYFYNSSATTTTAKCISFSGVWTANIQENSFRGRGPGGAPTSGIGGYGLFIVLGDDFNTSVMNLNISNNQFLTLGFPYWCPNRTLQVGGRVEGISITNNTFVAGNTAIVSHKSLATMITGNLISDYHIGIELNGDFSFVVGNNTEVDGNSSSIKISSLSDSFVERGVISGNKIGASPDGIGIELINNLSVIRGLSICGNYIGRSVGTPSTNIGIKFNNTNSIDSVSITGNAFQSLLTAVDVGTISGQDNVISGNTCSFVTNPTTQLSTGYAITTVITLTGGAPKENVDIPIPSNMFFNPPIAGFLMEDGSLGLNLIGFFKNAAVPGSTTTKTNAQFDVRTFDGLNIPAGRTTRFTVYLVGK